MRGARGLLADPARGRKRDFVPRVRISSVKKRGSFADWKEGELGREVWERERGREAGRGDWEGGEVGEEEREARRKEKVRKSFMFDFWVVEGALGDARIVGVERALERVESGDIVGESATRSSGR